MKNVFLLTTAIEYKCGNQYKVLSEIFYTHFSLLCPMHIYLIPNNSLITLNVRT